MNDPFYSSEKYSLRPEREDDLSVSFETFSTDSALLSSVLRTDGAVFELNFLQKMFFAVTHYFHKAFLYFAASICEYA